MLTATKKALILSLLLCLSIAVQAQDRIFSATDNDFSRAVLRLANPVRPPNGNVAIGKASFVNQVQVQLSLTGVVHDPSGAAISGVELTVRNKSTGRVATAVTDENGRFSIPGLVPGSYSVSVSAPGFGVTQRDVELTPGQSATIDIQLGTDVPVGTSIGPSNGGGSGSSRPGGDRRSASPSNRTPNSPSKTTDIFDQSFERDIELMNWLNLQKNDRKRLSRIIFVTDNRSLFVFENVKAGTKFNYTPMLVNESLDPNNLLTRINQHVDKTFIGIHRFSHNSYLMVFYD